MTSSARLRLVHPGDITAARMFAALADREQEALSWRLRNGARSAKRPITLPVVQFLARPLIPDDDGRMYAVVKELQLDLLPCSGLGQN